LNLKGKAKVLKLKMKGEEDIKIEVLNKIYMRSVISIVGF
jgi:hypothetical protein